MDTFEFIAEVRMIVSARNPFEALDKVHFDLEKVCSEIMHIEEV